MPASVIMPVVAIDSLDARQHLCLGASNEERGRAWISASVLWLMCSLAVRTQCISPIHMQYRPAGTALERSLVFHPSSSSSEMFLFAAFHECCG